MSYTLYVTGTVPRHSEQDLRNLLGPIGGAIDFKSGGLILLPGPLSKEALEKVHLILAKRGFSVISDSRANIVRKVKSLLEETIDKLQNKIKLSEYLSSAVPYEYHYLSGVFSQVEGKSIEQFFIGLKIERIKELLKDEKLSISEIAYLCGYSSPAHLTNQFKRTTGYTPSEYKIQFLK
jgi:AraC-like DNA-binding protein